MRDKADLIVDCDFFDFDLPNEITASFIACHSHSLVHAHEIQSQTRVPASDSLEIVADMFVSQATQNLSVVSHLSHRLS